MICGFEVNIYSFIKIRTPRLRVKRQPEVKKNGILTKCNRHCGEEWY